MLGDGPMRRVQNNPGAGLLPEAGEMVSGQHLGCTVSSLKLHGELGQLGLHKPRTQVGDLRTWATTSQPLSFILQQLGHH